MWDNTFQIIISASLIPPLLWLYFRLRMKTLATFSSAISGEIKVIEKYNHEKALTLNNYVQGVSINHPSISQSYWYLVAQKIARICQKENIASLLMFGLGANTVPNLLAKQQSKIHQTIVEIDPLILQACIKYFGLSELKNTTLINEDAYLLIAGKSEYTLPLKTFKVIFVDIYTGGPPFVDPKSTEPNFINSLTKFLKKDGVIIFNRPADTAKIRQENQKLKAALEKHFPKVTSDFIADPRGFKNDIICAFLFQDA